MARREHNDHDRWTSTLDIRGHPMCDKWLKPFPTYHASARKMSPPCLNYLWGLTLHHALRRMAGLFPSLFGFLGAGGRLPKARRGRVLSCNSSSSLPLPLGAIPDAPCECGVPTPPCSAFRLLSSPSHSRTRPFADSQWQEEPPRFLEATADTPAAVKEPTHSHDPTTWPLRESPCRQ